MGAVGTSGVGDKVKRAFAVIAMAMAALLGGVSWAMAPANGLQQPASVSRATFANAQGLAPVPDAVPVALLVDVTSGQTLYSRDPRRRFMPASVTKVMTVYSAFQLMAEGKLSPQMHYRISQQLQDEWSGHGSSMFLKAGDRPTIAQLLIGATTVSGNDACVAIALAATGSLEKWVALMNRNASALGMVDTHYGSPNGFPDGGRTFSTAADQALLLEALITRFPRYYRDYFGLHGMSWNGITQANHDPITRQVAGADGGKTGFSNEAGYTFLGSGERGGQRLIIMLAGIPDARLRNETARKLLNWGFDAFTARLLVPRDTVVGTALVQGGSAGRVALRTVGPVSIVLPRGSRSGVAMSIRYRGPVYAPIAKGDPIAQLHVEIAGERPADFPLEAASAVPEANLAQRIGAGLKALFG